MSTYLAVQYQVRDIFFAFIHTVLYNHISHLNASACLPPSQRKERRAPQRDGMIDQKQEVSLVFLLRSTVKLKHRIHMAFFNLRVRCQKFVLQITQKASLQDTNKR